MKKVLLSFMLLYGALNLNAQTVTFETSIPNTWTSTGTMFWSSAHYKDGIKSLKWTASNNQVLTVSSIDSIGTAQTGSKSNGTTHF